MKYPKLEFEHNYATRLIAFPAQKLTEENFGGDTGIVRGMRLTQRDVNLILDAISQHLHKNLKKRSPQVAASLINQGLNSYHKIVDDQLHQQALSKLGRTLPKHANQEISKIQLFQYIRDLADDYEIADEEGRGYEQLCFRISRPNKPSDVGSLHCDTWFWDYHNFTLKNLHGRFKCWLQLAGDPKKSGLLLAPKSHAKKLEYEVKKTPHKLEFIQSEPFEQLDLYMFSDEIGTPVMFNHDVLHGGSINSGTTPRISIEFTVVFREQNG